MAWLKRKVQGHIESFRGERKSSSTDKVNVDVKIQGPDDGLHLSDLESSLSSSQGDFRTLIKQQKEQEEAEEAKKSKGSKLKVKGHRRGRSDGSIFIKQKQNRESDQTAIFDVSNQLLRQMSTSSGSLEYKGSFGHIQNIQREFTNLSFLTEDEGDGGSVERALEKWKAHRDTLDMDYNKVKLAIEERQQLLVSMVTRYASELMEKLERKYQEQRSQAERCIHNLETCQKGSQSVLTDPTSPSDPSSVLSSLPSVPSRLGQLTHQTEGSMSEVVTQLFGHFQTIQARGSVCPEVGGEGMEGQEDESSSQRLMTRPQYLGNISTKTSKDGRECGLTDLALTKDRQVIVVDKHNKLVKLFDTEGKLVRYIGRNLLKDPSRVSVLPWSEQVLVTDSGSQELKLFTLEGAVVNTVAPDLSAPSGHCVIPDTRQIAVINFDTKLVSIYEEDTEGVGGFRKLRSFPTGLDCPAYIACTASKNIVISDWSAHKLRIYDGQGKFLKQISKTGAGQGQISKPQGVHGDCHGNLFLGEKGNRRVQIFKEDGESTFIMDKKTYELNLPMALDTTGDGYLTVAEYQGNVKFYKYLDLPNAGALIVGQKPKGRATSVVSPELLLPTNESAL